VIPVARSWSGLDTERMKSAEGMEPETKLDVEAGRRASRMADLVLTIVGLLLLAPAVLGLAWMGMWVGTVTTRCGGYVCNDVVAAGIFTASFGAPIVWVVALVASIVLLVLRRRASWIPPIAFLVAIGVQFASAWLADWGAGLSLL
jgi:hypothetical protein